jgi:peptidoglycan/xylan/chitin deacetylase (PgdA/CDA1 family)
MKYPTRFDSTGARKRRKPFVVAGLLLVALLLGGLALALPNSTQAQSTESNPSPLKIKTLQDWPQGKQDQDVDLLLLQQSSILGNLDTLTLKGNNLEQSEPEQPAPTSQPTSAPVAVHSQLNVPSLMFHHIRKLSGTRGMAALDRYSTDPDLFVKMLDWIEQNGYHTVTTGQIADFLNNGTALPEKPINLRFDDGWQNQLFAAREMQKRGMTATFFIISQAHTGAYMSWDQVKQLDTMGFEVAAHTQSHPFLTRSRNASSEISGSKQDLEKLLGHSVNSFAYPYGDYNSRIEGLVKAAGYKIAVGVGKGYTWSQKAEFHEPALTMESLTTLNQFIRRVTNTGW